MINESDIKGMAEDTGRTGEDTEGSQETASEEEGTREKEEKPEGRIDSKKLC